MYEREIADLYAQYIALELAAFGDGGRPLRVTMQMVEHQIVVALKRVGGVAMIGPHMALRLEEAVTGTRTLGQWFTAVGDHDRHRHPNDASNTTLAINLTPRAWKRGLMIEPPPTK